MATIKAVLARQQERLNLRNVSLCVVLVVLLVSFVFGLLTFKPLLRDTADQNGVEAQAGEAHTGR